MGIFGIGKGKSKDATDAKVKKVKEPKQKRGGSKRKKSMIDRMGLRESVAAIGLDSLREVAAQASAVRELDEGYTAIAITEEMLIESGISVGSEEFGSFAEAVRSGHIASLLLRADLDRGVLVIIPDDNSLEVLDNFSFIRDLGVYWAIVPFDIDDDSSVDVLDANVSIGDLINIVADNSELSYVNGDIVIDGELGDVSDDYHQGSFDVANDVYDEDDVNDIDLDDDSESYGVDLGEDELEPEDDYVDEPDFEFDDAGDVVDTVAYESDDDQYDVDESSDSGYYVEVSDEDAMTVVDRIMTRSFVNDELGVHVDESVFDLHFDNKDTNVLLFDESATDDSTLSLTLVQMRKDANVELRKLHAKHVQELRSTFNISMAKSHDRLVSILDYTNDATPLGGKYKNIRLNRDDMLARADELLAKRRVEMDEKYNDRRNVVGNQAFNMAVEKFDELHKNQHMIAKSTLQDEIISEITMESDREVAELYDERTLLARRLFDKTTTNTLVELQTSFMAMSKAELAMHDSFRQRFDRYLRSNFANEVLRAKAISEQQRQRAEGDKIREQYESLVANKDALLRAANTDADQRVTELLSRQTQELNESAVKYQATISELERRNDQLVNRIDSLQSDVTTMDERKSNEYKNQLASKEDIIKGQKEQLIYAEERASKTTKSNGVIIGIFAVVTLIIGLMCGFVFGNTTGQQSATRMAEAKTATSVSVQHQDAKKDAGNTPTVIINQGGTQDSKKTEESKTVDSKTEDKSKRAESASTTTTSEAHSSQASH